MTSEDIESELNRYPFIPFRLHLVSGKTIDVRMSGLATMFRNAVLITHLKSEMEQDPGYDMIALRNIERLEQLKWGDA
jgi:hypothetical protein